LGSFASASLIRAANYIIFLKDPTPNEAILHRLSRLSLPKVEIFVI
jgi:hypothetical protein